MIRNSEDITLEKFLDCSYSEILKSINKEKYILDYPKFDLFYEIKYDDNVVGFITLEDIDFDGCLIINEVYIEPNFRGNNLFFKNYCDIINNTDKRVFLRKPNKNLINVLIHNDVAFLLPEDIVISYIDFVVELKDSYKNSKIKHFYKKIKDENLIFIGNLFDLNLGGVLFFDNEHIFSKDYDSLIICEARKYDLKKYSIRKKLNKIQPKYIDETLKLVFKNLSKSFDFFKGLDANLSNSNKLRNKFLNENPQFKDDEIKIPPSYEFIVKCPFCDDIVHKSNIYCHNCGLNLEKTIIRNENKLNTSSVNDDYEDYYNHINSEDDDYFDRIDDAAEDLKERMGEDNMKEFLSKLIKSSGELAFSSKVTHKDPIKSLNTIDYEYLELDEDKYDDKENEELNIEKSIYAIVKYTNEHPTNWMMDYYLKSIDFSQYDSAVERGYFTKIMPEQFPELFKNYTVEELIRESESYQPPNTTKEDMIKEFMETANWSDVVSQKGLDYLNSNPFLEFFTNNLIDFDIYEFKLYADKYQDKLSLEEIGNKYVNAKLKKAISDEEYDLYLNYVDYYFNLNMSKNNFKKACVYLTQRIIYETNSWHLKEFHVAFDEVFSIMTDYLLFKITKLNLDLDLFEIYDEAYNELKLENLKFDYDENYNILYRLMNGEDIYEISGELLDKSKDEGKFKTLFD